MWSALHHFLILLVEALCFILDNGNVGNFQKTRMARTVLRYIARNCLSILCFQGSSYDLHCHNIVLQFHASFILIPQEAAEGLGAAKGKVMKKFFLCLVTLLTVSVASVFAQSSLVAVLNHNDTISMFYGITALSQAYNKSVDGDVITLSSGNFNATTLYKNISICGAGMEQDSVNNIQPTVLIGDFTIAPPMSATNRLTLESIYHSGKITLGKAKTSSSAAQDVNKVQFVKCRLGELICAKSSLSASYGSTSTEGCNASVEALSVIQCTINNITALGRATIVNSYVGAPGMPSNSLSNDRMHYECTNCVVYGSLANNHVKYSTFTNCILIGSNTLASTNMASNCIGIYTGSVSDTDLFSDLPQASNVSFTKSSDVFKTFRANGTASVKDSDSFELLDAVKEKYLGTDGTEIGMYGGNLPFNPQPMSLKIKKFNVASKSTLDGKLSVDIEVAGVE